MMFMLGGGVLQQPRDDAASFCRPSWVYRKKAGQVLSLGGGVTLLALPFVGTHDQSLRKILARLWLALLGLGHGPHGLAAQSAVEL